MALVGAFLPMTRVDGANARLETAAFGAGCFWGVEAAFRQRHQGARSALERAHGGVAVDTHHQQVGRGLRALKITDMPHVQEIETPIGEGDGFSLPPGPAPQGGQIP